MTEWNRCSEGLPRVGEIVAICAQDLQRVRHAFGFLKFLEPSQQNSAVACWVTLGNENQIPLEFVTHWWRVPLLPPEAKTWTPASLRPMRATAEEWRRNEEKRPSIPREVSSDDFWVDRPNSLERLRSRVEYSSSLGRALGVC